MNIVLRTPSPIGDYDRNTTLLITQRDGSQQLYPRKTKSGHHQLAPLVWWKKCGFVTEERDQWMKSIIHPEHAQIMKHAGIKPSDLFGTVLSPSDVEDVLGWLNMYREVYGETPGSLLTFRKFMADIDACGASARTANPLKVANYVKTFSGTAVNMEAFFFTLHDQEWMNAVRANIADRRENFSYRKAVMTLMQLGASPESVAVLTAGEKDLMFGKYLGDAVTAYAMAGKLSSSNDCYSEIRQLTDIIRLMPMYSEACSELFLSEDTNRSLFHRLVTVDRLTDMFPITAILKEEVASALVGGFL